MFAQQTVKDVIRTGINQIAERSAGTLVVVKFFISILIIMLSLSSLQQSKIKRINVNTSFAYMFSKHMICFELQI